MHLYKETFLAWLSIASAQSHAKPLRRESKLAVREIFTSTTPRASCSLRNPSPTKSICGSDGKVSRPDPLCAPLKYNTYEACRDLCSRKAFPPNTQQYDNPGCVSFSFTNSTGECNLYQLTVRDQHFMITNQNDIKFWDISCFDCPLQCPSQPFGTNLMENGNFENSLLGPWQQVYVGSVQNGIGVNSSRAFQCTKEDCEIDQSFVACRYSFYRLGFSYRIDGPQPSRNTITLFVDGAYGGYIPDTTDWNFNEIWFQAPYARINNLDFFFYAPASGSNKHHYYVDNVKLERVSGSFAPAAGAAEMAPNGGFESGEIAPWKARHTRKTKFSIVSPGLKGSYAVRFTGRASGETGTPSYLYASFDVVAGKAYLLRYTMKKQTDGAQFGYVDVDGIQPIQPVTQIMNGTLHYKLPFRASTNLLQLQFTLFFGPLLIDDISVKELA